MAYPVKTNILPLLRHLVEALRPFAEANFVGLVFEPKAGTVAFSFYPEGIIKSVSQILCRAITFTPSGFEVRLSVELPDQALKKRLLITVANTGVCLGALKEITSGLPLPVEVKGPDARGTRFELSLSLDTEEGTGAEKPLPVPQEKGRNNVPVLYQKLRQRMQAYATTIKSLEEAVAREHKQRDQVFLKKVNAIILANLSRDDFDVRALARSLALSRTQLYRRLNPLIHLPPSRYIRFIRLQKAKEYLEKGEMDVGEACFRVGFVSKSHFTRAFHRQFGFNPSCLRKSFTKQITRS
ncbi:MAG: helix-turn-helix transcriptional regulator [Lewinellaceae bacterium]|nr:helix-turn-helix transcriptional regulator [Phaeodactylibacter sp.]MCB9036357.1 helix-turn-helix transcriptional regulator [Lewinellaceae bacterium]